MSTVTEEPPSQNTSACKEMPRPPKEHGVLQKFVGEWESEAILGPDGSWNTMMTINLRRKNS